MFDRRFMRYDDRQQVGHPFLNFKKDRKNNIIISLPALADDEYLFPFDNPVRKDVFLGCFIAPYFHLVEAGIADRFNGWMRQQKIAEGNFIVVRHR